MNAHHKALSLNKVQIALIVILCLITVQGLKLPPSGRALGQGEYQTYLPLVMRSSFVPSDGQLDWDFGQYGMLTSSFTADRGYGRAVALQPDGKLLLAGSLELSVDNDAFVLARYNTDGSLDTSFDQDGWLVTDLSAASDQINDLILQDDGQILVAGSSAYSGESDFALARYNPDGSLDSTFDGDGWLVTDFGAGAGFAQSLLLQPDGKIVAAGTALEADIPGLQDFALARYNSDGSLDTTFGSGGRLQINYGYNESASSLALQPDGKIVVAGSGYSPGIGWAYFYFVLARLNTNGSLDTQFDSDGWVTSDFFSGGGSDGCEDLLLQPDGKIVAAGWANDDTRGLKVFAMARYNPDGSLDTGFSGDGKVTSVFSDDDYFGASLALLPDGSLLLAGTAQFYDHFFAESAFTLARYTSDGGLDSTFDGDGWLTTFVQPYSNQCGDMLVLPGALHSSAGQIVLAGSVAGDLALLRYDPDGTLDAAFDLDGMALTDLTVDSESGRAVVLQPDGKILVAGYGWDGASGDQLILARYTPAGELDTSFDGDGWAAINPSPLADQINDLVLQPDGKILVAGDTQDPDDQSYDFALARFNPDGSPDSSFDSDGWLSTDFYGLDDHANSLALQPDGSILVAGSAQVPGEDYDIALARYFPDGSLDTSFGDAGKVVTDSGIQKEDFGFSVALQKDGQILVSGGITLFTGTDFFHRFAVLRYNPDGSLDNTFDGDGLVITEFYNNYEVAYDVLLQRDGKILAAGWVNAAQDTDFALARYNPDGSLDTSFGVDGKLSTDFDSQHNLGWAIALQPDGRILMAGYSDISGASIETEGIFLLARYTSHGALDTSFSENGWMTIDFSTYDDECYALALQPDGTIILAGESGGDFALARIK